MKANRYKFIQALARASVIGALSFSGVGCNKNLFAETAEKTSDPALLYDARLLLDKGDYTGALDSIALMSTAGLANHETKAIRASAYAGRCGLNLISLASSLGNMGTNTLFQALFNAMKGSTAAKIADCQAAETELVGITSPTPDEKILVAFVELAKIGSILNDTGDANNDDALDGTYNPCSSTDISDALAAEVGTGITLAAKALQGSAVGSSAMAPIAGLCTAIDTALGTTGFCNQTSASDFVGAKLKAVRSVVRANEIGLKVCSGDISTCACP